MCRAAMRNCSLLRAATWPTRSCIWKWHERTLASKMGARGTVVRIHHISEGIGKLVNIRSGQAEIEFFDSPVGPRLVRSKYPQAL